MCLEMLVSDERSFAAMAQTGIGSFSSSLRMSQRDKLEIAESWRAVGSRGLRFFAAGEEEFGDGSAMIRATCGIFRISIAYSFDHFKLIPEQLSFTNESFNLNTQDHYFKFEM